MNNTITNRIIEELAGAIDIPDSAYEKAEARYKDLGEWFGRKEARCHVFAPHIYLQGSFRLGTVSAIWCFSSSQNPFLLIAFSEF